MRIQDVTPGEFYAITPHHNRRRAQLGTDSLLKAQVVRIADKNEVRGVGRILVGFYAPRYRSWELPTRDAVNPIDPQTRWVSGAEIAGTWAEYGDTQYKRNMAMQRSACERTLQMASGAEIAREVGGRLGFPSGKGVACYGGYSFSFSREAGEALLDLIRKCTREAEESHKMLREGYTLQWMPDPARRCEHCEGPCRES